MGGVPAEARGEARGRGWAVASALRDRLPMWVQLRCGLEPKTLGALAVVLVVAAMLAAQHFWSARPQSVSAPETVGAAVPASGVPSRPVPEGPGPLALPPPPQQQQTAGPSAEAARVVVDVGGEVRRPGVLRLPPGSRVADALHAAGGAKPGTDLTWLNRARVLVDGEQLVVDGQAPSDPAPAGAGGGAVGAGGMVGAAGGGDAAGGPLSLNTATLEQFDTLPGVGPVLAQRIVDYRTQHGGFRSVDELREVSGIGDRRFADLQPLVRP
ncbi:ComEA family DNA-binding protein [Streptomyces sp. NBC_01429]|uniref:ComEA family DNA-binding protein n=1 Tax=Streptomyces sp. NBC_01429 TaxID=2903862 RepID=UPI002E2AD4F7|nr:ComEA family DNA-binding protein [Streptomyces sp. NBC_01429]